MDSNLQDRIESLHQEAASFYLQGEFQSALTAWRTLLQLDGEDERAREGVQLCEMLADENVQHQSIQELMNSPAPAVASDAETGNPAILDMLSPTTTGELDDLEQMLDDHLGMGEFLTDLDPTGADNESSFAESNSFLGEAPDPAIGPEPPIDALTSSIIDGNGLKPSLDKQEAEAANRAAEAELRRRVVELMAQARSALDAQDRDFALGLVKRVLILDDVHEEALRLRAQIEGRPMESFSQASSEMDDEIGMPSMQDEPELLDFDSGSADSPFEATAFDSEAYSPLEQTVEEDLLADVSFEDLPDDQFQMPSFDTSGSTDNGFVPAPPVLESTEPIGQEGELPPATEGINLAADPAKLRSRTEDALNDMRSEAGADSIPDDLYDSDIDADTDRHAALNKAAAKLAKIKAEESAQVSVRRLGRGLVLGVMAMVILAVAIFAAVRFLDVLGSAAEEAAGSAIPVESRTADKSVAAKNPAEAAEAEPTPDVAVSQADVDRWLRAATAAAAEERYPEAIQQFGQILRVRPEHPVAKRALQALAARFQAQQELAQKEQDAFQSFERGDYRSALRAFYRLPEETGKNYDREIANGWYNLGVTALQNGNCSGARDHFAELRAVRPNDSMLATVGPLVMACPTNQGGPGFLSAVGALTLRAADS